MNRNLNEGTFNPPANWNQTVVVTVDVEDYFMSPECIPFREWDSFPSMIHTGMERILSLLEEYRAKATFFFLGWVAERYPELVKWTVDSGHEIATHTFDHRFVSDLDESQFSESVTRSLTILRELAGGQPVHGHRAPAFSLDIRKAWQFDILLENGIVYDSSINPHGTYLYGDSGSRRFPYSLHGLVEIPPGAVEFAGFRMPVGGGGTMRLFPELYLSRARARFQSEGFPPVIYVHPWEFVPEHPPIHLPPKLHFIHWIGIKTMEEKLRTVLANNRILTMDEYYRELIREEEK